MIGVRHLCSGDEVWLASYSTWKVIGIKGFVSGCLSYQDKTRPGQKLHEPVSMVRNS